MATIAGGFFERERRPDALSGTPRAHAIDRWIFVGMAVWFIAITLTGFIPDSIMKVGMVQAGARPPFPIVLHMHAVLMGSFLLILFTQTWLMATGRRGLHMQLGVLGMVVAAALVAVGFVLAPTMYYQTWNALQSAPPAGRAELQQVLSVKDNILLLQMRIGILFPLFLVIGLRARGANAGLHKRMMFLATVMALPAGIDRISWLPTAFPASPLSVDLYTVLAISPMLVWDLVRNRRLHEAYWIWFAVTIPAAVVVNLLWDTAAWHATARQILGV
ncbi:hypothetical protein [Sphingomonas sp. URHD0057]|uniref:hypothetical protein n=1 Tax=Sphingomonas sp. URHD0057 TaxID=1380389 RepID=UPI000AF17827|nr:hypothetical protein [Sphingomonas sp. URHD0057]